MNTKTVKTCENCGSGIETKRHWNCVVCGNPIHQTIDADQWFAKAQDNENDFRNLQLEDYRQSQNETV